MKHVRSFDIFGKQVNFNVSKNDKEYKSVFGAIMTFVVVLITVTYFIARVNILREYGDTVHIETQEPVIYTADDPLT